MKATFCLSLSAVVMLLAAAPALSDSNTAMPGQKLDSGLGELPHYSMWADLTGRLPLGHRVLGESLDDGLGALPHYSKWVDRTARDPLGTGTARVALANR